MAIVGRRPMRALVVHDDFEGAGESGNGAFNRRPDDVASVHALKFDVRQDVDNPMESVALLSQHRASDAWRKHPSSDNLLLRIGDERKEMWADDVNRGDRASVG